MAAASSSSSSSSRQRDDRRGRGTGQRGARRRLDARRSVRPGFSHEKALIFGVIQVLAGIAALILGVVSISTRAWGYYYAAGFWSGTLFFVAGVFGLASARRKSNCTIVTFMVFSAMSAILALVTLTLSAIGVATENMLFQQQQHVGQSSALAVHSLIIVVSAIAAVCGTASSIVGCRAVCGVWYLPDNPYHSADLQTPTSAEFTAFRQNSNLQYLIDPDFRSQAQHLFATGGASDGGSGGDARGVGTASICPPASYEYPASAALATSPPPPPTIAPPSGPQQIAILAPAADGSVYGMVQASSDQAGGISQVMYIMPNTGPCPQPGAVSESVPEPPCTPPPSYSQINLTVVGLDDSADSGARERQHSGNSSFTSGHVHTSSGREVELPGYTVVAGGQSGGSSASNQVVVGEAPPFPTQLPPLDRLIPLTGTRPLPPRPQHRTSSARPTSQTSSRTSGTQTCPAVGGGSVSVTHAQQSQRPHHRIQVASSSSTQRQSSDLSNHRDAGHRRPVSEYRSGGSSVGESSGGATCHRHSQSVGTQVGPQVRSGNGRSSASRHHSSSQGSSRPSSMSGPGGGRSSRGTRDRHKTSEQHGAGSGARDSEQFADSGNQQITSRSSSHSQQHRTSGGVPCSTNNPQSQWRHSGSHLMSQATGATSYPQEIEVTSPESGGHRRWVPPPVHPPQYTTEQPNNLSPLNSVL